MQTRAGTRATLFLVALSSCSTIVSHRCSVMGRGKQWSADTVREVKTLMNIGLPLLRIAAQTGVVLQTLRSFSARLKKGYNCDKHSTHCGARPKQTDEMRRSVSDHLLARPRASVLGTSACGSTRGCRKTSPPLTSGSPNTGSTRSLRTTQARWSVALSTCVTGRWVLFSSCRPGAKSTRTRGLT